MASVTRSYCYRAYPDKADQPRLIETMQRMKRAHRALFDAPGDLAAGLQAAIGDLWWPNRDLVREWVIVSRRMRRKPIHCAPGGVLAGVSQSKSNNAWQMLQTSKLAVVEHVEGEFYRMTMLVDDKLPVTIPFRRHRPFPEKAQLVRWQLVAEPRKNGRYCWHLQFALKFDVPEANRTVGPPRIGGIDVGWRRVKEGFRVATLVVDGQAVFYALPWHDLYCQPKKTLSDGELRQFHQWRLDHYRKIAVDIARRCDEVRIERLNLRKLRDSGAPREARRYVSPSLLMRCIADAVEGAGKRLIYVRAPRTSTDCSICGEGEMIRSAQLKWRCQLCGGEIDQDENAATNISRREPLAIAEERLPWNKKRAGNEEE